MKLRLTALIAMISLIGLMFSCATSNNVTSNRGIQKRKYNKGFYVEKNTKLGGDHKQAEKVKEIVSLAEEKTVVDNENKIKKTITNKEEASTVTNDQAIAFPVEKASESIVAPIKVENDPVLAEMETMPKERVRLKEQVQRKMRKTLRVLKNTTASSSAPDDVLIFVLLVILAFILPPLAVFLYAGVDRPFWIDLILWLLGLGLGSLIFSGGLIWLCALIATVYALLIIFDVV